MNSNDMGDQFEKAVAEASLYQGFRPLYESLKAFGDLARDNLHVRARWPTQDFTPRAHETVINIVDLEPKGGSRFPVGIARNTGAKTSYMTALQVDMKDAVKKEDEIFFNTGYWAAATSVRYIGSREGAVASLGKSAAGWCEKEDTKDYASFWIVAESKPGGETSFRIRPYRGWDDNFGTSNTRNLFPRKWGGLGPHHTWFSAYDLPLIDKETGFRQETYTSPDGTVPKELVQDFLRLYQTGVNRGLLTSPSQPAPARHMAARVG
jgi:hypothetical protein